VAIMFPSVDRVGSEWECTDKNTKNLLIV